MDFEKQQYERAMRWYNLPDKDKKFVLESHVGSAFEPNSELYECYWAFYILLHYKWFKKEIKELDRKRYKGFNLYILKSFILWLLGIL